MITTYCALPASQAEKNLWPISGRTVLPFLGYAVGILASSGWSSVCPGTSSISFLQLARLFESVQIWLPFLCSWHLLLEDSRKVHSRLVTNILNLLSRLPGRDVELFCRPCRSRTREKGWKLRSPVSSMVASCWTFSLLSRKPSTSASVMGSKSGLAFTIFLIYHILGVNFSYEVW